MKLFKRTSIFLSIVIVLLWAFVMIFINYPQNNIRVTHTEKQETKKLLEKHDIKVEDKMLDMHVYSLKIPAISYPDLSCELDEYVQKGKLKKVSEDRYKFDKSEIQFSGKSVIISGKSQILDKVTSDNALSKSRALIDWLNLSKKNMSVYVYEKMDGFLITYVPEYNKKRIFDLKINVMLYGSQKYKVEFVPYKLKNTGKTQLPESVCSVLCQLALGGECEGEKITEMTLGYKLDETLLKPAWEIKTDSNNVFYID